jgi:sugar-specific transcriptional regulator TrmB
MSVIRQLVEEKTLKILDLLLKNKQKHFHLSEISNKSKIPIASTFRIINKLVSLKIVDVTIIGKMKIYRISKNKETIDLDSNLNKK